MGDRQNFNHSFRIALRANPYRRRGRPLCYAKIIDVTAFQKKITTFRRIDYGVNSEANTPAVIRFNCAPQGVYHKNFDLVSQSFSQFIEKGYTLYILSDSEKQIERLQAIFEERGDSISFTPVLKTLHEGFVDNDLKIGCFTDHQIFDRFHKYTLKSEHARSGKLALSLKELNQIEVGDYIVHVDHGIGRFGGLIHTEINGKMQEVIKLTYQNDDIILSAFTPCTNWRNTGQKREKLLVSTNWEAVLGNA